MAGSTLPEIESGTAEHRGAFVGFAMGRLDGRAAFHGNRWANEKALLAVSSPEMFQYLVYLVAGELRLVLCSFGD